MTRRMPLLEAFLFDCFFQNTLEIENTQLTLNLSLLEFRSLLLELLAK